MNKRLGISLVILMFALIAGSTNPLYANEQHKAVASAEETHPILVGEIIPDVSVETVDGKTVQLLELVRSKPTVLIFYRGGWCPYCNTHLGRLSKIESELRAAGYQILAISPDRPEKLKISINKLELTYTLLSDSDLEAAKAFGIAFTVDDKTLVMYKNFGIDLEDASGKKHHMLPVPAAFVLDRKGAILFSHVNPDYKRRVNSKLLLKEALKAVEKP